MIKGLVIGDKIPNFKLKNQKGEWFEMSNIIGKKKIVLYFYPKDETLVCTKQACLFRDSYEEFKTLGCEVVGISADGEESHQNFSNNHQLNFILLSDRGNKIRNEFGIPKDFLGLISGRYTLIIDLEGEIVNIFNSAFNAQKHIKSALDTIKKM